MIALRRSLVASLLVTASAFAADPEVNAAPAADAPAAKPAESVSKPAEPVAAAATDGTYEKPTRGEQLAFYTAGGIYGLTAGLWINSLFSVSNPGMAVVFPVVLGTSGLAGAYAVDASLSPRRGVLAASTLGMAIGAANAAGISLAQSAYNSGSDSWNTATQGGLTFLLMTAGAAGGYAYGEYVHPDTKAVAFVGSGAAWGAMTGALFGAGAMDSEWNAGASLWGTIGLNAGAIATAAVAAGGGAPSFKTQRYMWYGYGAGTALSSLVYIAYAFSDDNPRVGLITNALGSVAGLAVGAVLGAGMEDEPETASTTWSNTHFAFSPVSGGGMAMASGSF